MKDYSLDLKEKGRFITNLCENANGTYDIIFADGSYFRGIEANEANLKKIVDIQEKQAKRGVENLSVFKDKKTKAGRFTWVSGIGTMAAATGATFIPVFHDLLSTQNPLLVVAGVGAITILGTIPAYCKFRKEKDKVEELEKIKYRDKNIEQLSKFREYHNALNGIKLDTQKALTSNFNPFSIIHIDDFTEDELRIIMDNIDKENAFQFTYKKRK